MNPSSKNMQSIQSLFSVNYLSSVLGLSLAYFLAGMLGLEMQSAQTGITPFWPASGIAIATFILYGIRLWPAIFIGMIGIAAIKNIPIPLVLIPAAGSVLEAVIPLLIARRYGFTGSLSSFRQLLIFISIAWAGPLISAFLGMLSSTSSAIELTMPAKNIFLIWWLGNSFGILLVGSSIILLYQCIKNFSCLIPKSPILLGIAVIASIISFTAFQNMTNLNSALILNLMIPLVILSSIIIGFAGTLIPVSIATVTLVIMFPSFPDEATRLYPLGLLYLDILELWIITLTGLLVSIAYKDGIKHIRSSWLNTHDGLTTLRNRHFLNKKLDRLCFGLRQRDSNFCLLFLDLNKFKLVNDSAGHLAGDAGLVHVAHLLKDSTRMSDTVARWGGDEFLILLPDCPEQTAISIAKKINTQLKNTPFKHKQMSFELSFSIGIATSQIDDTPASITDRADRASYRAKESGEEIIMAQPG